MRAWIKSWVKTQFDNFANRVAAIFARKSDIPTKTSDLTNDSGFKTFDAVTSVNGKTGAVNIEIPAAYNGTLTIQKNGTNVQTFTANQSTNAIANIEVPTVSSSPAVTVPNTYALDAREKNAAIDGTLANLLQQLNSKLTDKMTTVTILPMSDRTIGEEYAPEHDARNCSYFIPIINWEYTPAVMKTWHNNTYDAITCTGISMDTSIVTIRKVKILINKLTGAIKVENCFQTNLQSGSTWFLSPNSVPSVGLIGIKS